MHVLKLDARSPEHDAQGLVASRAVGGCGVDDDLRGRCDDPVETEVADLFFESAIEQVADGIELILAQIVEPDEIGFDPQVFALQALQVGPEPLGGDCVGAVGLHLEQGAQRFDAGGLGRRMIEELRPPGDALFQQFGVGDLAGRRVFRQFQEIGKNLLAQGTAEGKHDIHVLHGTGDISAAEPETRRFQLDIDAARGHLRCRLHRFFGFDEIAAVFLEPGDGGVGGAIGRIAADGGREVGICLRRVRLGDANPFGEQCLRVGFVPVQRKRPGIFFFTLEMPIRHVGDDDAPGEEPHGQQKQNQAGYRDRTVLRHVGGQGIGTETPGVYQSREGAPGIRAKRATATQLDSTNRASTRLAPLE